MEEISPLLASIDIDPDYHLTMLVALAAAFACSSAVSRSSVAGLRRPFFRRNPVTIIPGFRFYEESGRGDRYCEVV